MLLDRFVVGHSHADEHCENENHRGQLGAGSLSMHSLLDGVAIGLAFQVSQAVAMIVAVAVLTHDFSDGINTVSLILKNGGTRKEAFKWLVLDAIAPVLGILFTTLFTIPESYLGLLLALFCGFFLYIGASDLLPESHHRHPTYWTTFATILGVLILYGAIRVAGI
jgi:ZIP family zinc transporter